MRIHCEGNEQDVGSFQRLLSSSQHPESSLLPLTLVFFYSVSLILTWHPCSATYQPWPAPYMFCWNMRIEKEWKNKTFCDQCKRWEKKKRCQKRRHLIGHCLLFIATDAIFKANRRFNKWHDFLAILKFVIIYFLLKGIFLIFLKFSKNIFFLFSILFWVCVHFFRAIWFFFSLEKWIILKVTSIYE